MDYAHGVDISKWQGTPDMSKMINMSNFIIHRYSCGYWKDEKIDRNWGYMDGKTITGLYHFVHPETKASSARQKMHILAMINLNPNLPIVLDIEDRQVYIRLTYNLAYYAWQKAGKYPIIYTAPSVWRDLWKFSNGTHREFFKKCPLWIANYRIDTPDIPEPWTDWTFWQYKIETNQKIVEDYGLRYWESKAIDLDYFNGTHQELLTFAEMEEPAPPTGKEIGAEIICPFYWFRTHPLYEDLTKDIVLPEGYYVEFTGEEEFDDISGILFVRCKLKNGDYFGWISKNQKYIKIIVE